jgi:hypothetical protein
MPNQNLPFTPFPRHRRELERLPALPPVEGPADVPVPDDPGPPVGPADGLLVRVREMTPEAAAREVGVWTGAGAVEVDAPAPWRAWQRTRRDTATGAPRVLRLAVAGSAPAVVVNWSALDPVGRADESAWQGALRARAPHGGGEPAGPGGWTA